MLSLPGGQRQCKSGDKWLAGFAEICAECLAVPAAESPGKVRAGCKCQRPLRVTLEKWLDEWRGQQRKAALRGDVGALAVLRGLGEARESLKLSRVAEVYVKHGPKDAGKRVAHLRAMVEDSGLVWESQTMDLLIKDPLKWVRRWAEMRQEHFRRGWSVRGDEPGAAWAQLRAWHAAGKGKLDRGAVAAVNTTISGYLRDAKSIFGPEARTNYHGELRVPLVPEFLGIRLSLPKPKGMTRIDDGSYQKMWDAAAALRNENKRLWVLIMLAWRTGLRTVELLGARRDWLETAADGSVCLVLKNRPEQGFRLKAKDRALVRPIALDAAFLAEILEVASVKTAGRKRRQSDEPEAVDVVKDEDSLLGARTPGAAADLGRAASAWIRQFVNEGPHTLYWFRKLAGSIRFTQGDMKAAGALLGHAPGSTVTGDTYADLLARVPALGDDEIAPGKVSLRRV